MIIEMINLKTRYWLKNWKKLRLLQELIKSHKKVAMHTCCRIGRMYLSGSGENLFCFKKSYRFCSSISKTRHVWFLCWKHSNARTKLNSSAFSWLRRDRIETSICPWRAYDGWFLRILMATMSLVPFFQHFTTCPNVPRPKNSSTCNKNKKASRINFISDKYLCLIQNVCKLVNYAHKKNCGI